MNADKKNISEWTRVTKIPRMNEGKTSVVLSRNTCWTSTMKSGNPNNRQGASSSSYTLPAPPSSRPSCKEAKVNPHPWKPDLQFPHSCQFVYLRCTSQLCPVKEVDTFLQRWMAEKKCFVLGGTCGSLSSDGCHQLLYTCSQFAGLALSTHTPINNHQIWHPPPKLSKSISLPSYTPVRPHTIKPPYLTPAPICGRQIHTEFVTFYFSKNVKNRARSFARQWKTCSCFVNQL